MLFVEANSIAMPLFRMLMPVKTLFICEYQLSVLALISVAMFGDT